MFPAALVVCNDCFAYFCGRAFGRKFVTATFLKVSPNKTWEGFIGAFFCTLLFGFFASKFLAQVIEIKQEYLENSNNTNAKCLVFMDDVSNHSSSILG